MKPYAIAILFAIFAVVAAEEWEPKKLEEMGPSIRKCMSENAIPKEQLEKEIETGLEQSEGIRKLVLCNAKNFGFFCEENGYHPERLVKTFPTGMDEAEAIAMVEKCADKNEEKSPADVWAFRGYMCISKTEFGKKVKDLMFVDKQE